MYGHFFDRSVYAKDQIVKCPHALKHTFCIKCSECVCVCVCVYVKTSKSDYFCGLWKSFLSLYCMEFYKIRQKKKSYFQWQRVGQGCLSKKYTKQGMNHKKYGRKLWWKWRYIKLKLSWSHQYFALRKSKHFFQNSPILLIFKTIDFLLLWRRKS